jgi:hypothetical protein
MRGGSEREAYVPNLLLGDLWQAAFSSPGTHVGDLGAAVVGDWDTGTIAKLTN